MELNNNQVEYLRGRAALIVEDPTNELTELWLDWANANAEDVYTKDHRYVGTEDVLPVIWVFSKLYDCPPMVIFNLMKKSLRKRLAMLGFEQADFLEFEDANAALGEVIAELVPVNKRATTQEQAQVK